MKSKSIILIACAAIATLSFVSVNKTRPVEKTSVVKSVNDTQGTPGGFMSEDKL